MLYRNGLGIEIELLVKGKIVKLKPGQTVDVEDGRYKGVLIPVENAKEEKKHRFVITAASEENNANETESNISDEITNQTDDVEQPKKRSRGRPKKVVVVDDRPLSEQIEAEAKARREKANKEKRK